MKKIVKNTKINIQLLILLMFLGGSLWAQQQFDPTAITQEIDYKIDKYGDAQMEIRQKMTASQWQMFKAGPIAKNPSIFKRDLERSMATMVLDNYRTELNEDSRSSITTLTVRSMATYKGDGKWEFKLDAKEPNITKISDHVYMMTNNLASDGGGIIQQLQKIFFPENASNIKQGTDTYGNAIFTYTLHVEESSFNFLLIFGIVLLLIGAAWKFVPIWLKKK